MLLEAWKAATRCWMGDTLKAGEARRAVLEEPASTRPVREQVLKREAIADAR